MMEGVGTYRASIDKTGPYSGRTKKTLLTSSDGARSSRDYVANRALDPREYKIGETGINRRIKKTQIVATWRVEFCICKNTTLTVLSFGSFRNKLESVELNVMGKEKEKRDRILARNAAQM